MNKKVLKKGYGDAPKRSYKNKRDYSLSSLDKDKKANSKKSEGFKENKKINKNSENKGFKASKDFSDKNLNKDNGYDENPNLLIGRNPVLEAIKAGRTIDKILMQKDAQGSALNIAKKAREAGIQIQYVEKLVLDRIAPQRPHQGIIAYAAAHSYCSVDDILAYAKEKNEDPVVVILDNLEDPHNLGAILRSVDGAGFHGVIIPNRRSVSLTETVAKASAGAIEYVRVAKVSNLAQTVDYLKENGFWVASVDMDGTAYDKTDLNGALALIIGAEGFGVSDLLRKKSDFIVSIPMKGRVNSLNASNAAAIVLYECLRQRQ